MARPTDWTPIHDGITRRFRRQMGPYTLTVSLALYRWWWEIADGTTFENSESVFEDAESAMWAAEEVAAVHAQARALLKGKA
jgi:hypothetical protein